MRTYTLRYREAMPAILQIVEDTDLQQEIMLYPEKRYVLRGRGPDARIVRMWSEANTGDDWHELQVNEYYYLLLFDSTVTVAEQNWKTWHCHLRYSFL